MFACQDPGETSPNGTFLLAYEDEALGAEILYNNNADDVLNLPNQMSEEDETWLIYGKFPENDEQFQLLPEFIVERMKSYCPSASSEKVDSEKENDVDNNEAPEQQQMSADFNKFVCFYKGCVSDWHEPCNLCPLITHYLHGDDKAAYPLFCEAHLAHSDIQHAMFNLKPRDRAGVDDMITSSIAAEDLREEGVGGVGRPPVEEQLEVAEVSATTSEKMKLPACQQIIVNAFYGATRKVRLLVIILRINAKCFASYRLRILRPLIAPRS